MVASIGALEGFRQGGLGSGRPGLGSSMGDCQRSPSGPGLDLLNRSTAPLTRLGRIPTCDTRFRSSIRVCPGCCRQLVRWPERGAGVRLRPASLMSGVDVGRLLIRSSTEFGRGDGARGTRMTAGFGWR